MAQRAPTFAISGKLWRYPGPAGWYFITIGKRVAGRIRRVEGARKAGRGYLRISALIGETRWPTTLFPTKEKEFMLAVKAGVRKALGLEAGDTVRVEFQLEMEDFGT